QFILVNTSDHPIDVSHLKFEQAGATEATTRTFDANLWYAPGSTLSLEALLPKFCLQIWRIDRSQPTPGPACSIIPINQRAAWAKVADGKRFWIAQDAATTSFEVSQEGKTIATCSINAGHCEFTIP